MPANKKLSALTSATPAAGDYFYFAKDLGGGVFASRRSTLAGLLAALSGQSPTFAGLTVIGPANGQLLVGSSQTDATVKEAKLRIPHYLAAEENFLVLYPFSTATANEIYYGGGAAAQNAATRHVFSAASNNTTVSGTVIAIIDIAGLSVAGKLTATGAIGVNGSPALAKPTITGSRGGNAALANLLTQLALYGLITDSTSA